MNGLVVIGLLVLAILSSIGLMLYNAVVFVYVWTMFIAPSMDWPLVTMPTAIGFAFLFGLIGGNRVSPADWNAIRVNQTDTDSITPALGKVAGALTITTMVWLVAWIFVQLFGL